MGERLTFQITPISLTLRRFSCSNSFIERMLFVCCLLLDVQELVLHLSAEV